MERVAGLPSGELRWPISMVIAATAALQLLLPSQYTLGPHFLGPALELGLVGILTALNPRYIDQHTPQLRALALLLASVLTLFNVYNVLRLIHDLVTGAWTSGAASLLVTGSAIWIANVIIMSLWYWEHDLGGPARRLHQHDGRKPSFLFPQMTAPEFAEHGWRPMYLDYLYLSFTNASAFSPTDVLPLARWAKLAMMLQSALSLTTIAMVIARAINTL